MGGSAVEPAGEGEAGPLDGEDFVFDDVTIFGGKEKGRKKRMRYWRMLLREEKEEEREGTGTGG